MNRRDFLGALGLGMVASALPAWAHVETTGRSAMLPRLLDQTAGAVPALGLNTFPLRLCDLDHAADIVNRCLDVGISYLDTAPSHGDAEDKIGRAIQGRRGHCWLATETHLHEVAGAWQLLETSLRRLRTDYVNEWRISSVDAAQDLDRILDDDGAMAAAQIAKSKGLVGHIGLSGDSPELLIHALERYRFDAVRLIVNSVDQLDFPTIARELLPLAARRGVAVVAVKMPVDVFLNSASDTSLRQAFCQPLSCAVLDLDAPQMIARALAVARSLKPMTLENGA